HPLAAAAFAPALEELLAGLGRLAEGQPGGEQLLGEPLEVLQAEPLRAVTLLVGLLGLLQRVLAVEELQQEVLVVLEPVVAEADGVLDDVERPPLVLLRLDAEVGPQKDA